MTSWFWNWLTRYPSNNEFNKLSILKEKYLTNDEEIKYIHVTGSNGKGSVARYLHAVLSQNLNLKVGLFTSPHILVVNERIMINNDMISDQDLQRIKNIILDDVDKYQLSFFSILTLIALIYFQEKTVDWVIMEVGVGGLFDSTNIIRSDYVVLTSISKDHSELLGSSLADILRQKIGIIKSTTKKVFISGNLSVNLKHLVTKSILFHDFNDIEIFFAKKNISHNYILENKALATSVISTLFSDLDLNLVEKTLENVKNDLRFQVVRFLDKTIYFDAAHNLAAIEALIKMIKLNNIEINQIVFSSITSKHPKILIKKLSSNLTSNIFVCENNHKFSIKAVPFNFQKMILESKKNSTILVTGSCYFTAMVYQEFLINITKN